MAMPEWHGVAVTPSDADLKDRVIAALVAAGAEGVHDQGARVETHLPSRHEAEGVLARVRAVDPGADVVITPVVPVDWSVRWRDRIGAHALGVLVVAPPWLADGLDAARAVIIEPAMAFGTGEHPTTRGVIRLMADAVPAGGSVADAGAGSAVLAIAAAKLGAARVFAIESDADAIANAEGNVARNGVADRVVVIEGDAAALLPLIAPVDLLVANIISSVLLHLLPIMSAAVHPSGSMILSGILLEERALMLEACAGAGWRVVAEDAEDVWWSVRLAR